MTIVSTGYDGTVDEVQWAALIPSAGASEYGVYASGDWKVTAHPTTDKAVLVAPGKGWGQGVYDTSDASEVVQCDALTSGTRWDLVTASRNWQPVGGTTVFSKVTGGTTKVIPDTRLHQPGVQDDQPLALVQWTAGQTQPTAIVDLRCWAGNGGVTIADKLALTYLLRMGASVEFGGVQYQCKSDGNGNPIWVITSDSGSIPIFAAGPAISGSAPPAGTLLQTGTTVQKADGSGNAKLTFPKPFPTGLLSVLLFNGDGSALPAGWYTATSADRTGTTYKVWGFNAQGAPNQQANATHRVNWIAIGW